LGLGQDVLSRGAADEDSKVVSIGQLLKSVNVCARREGDAFGAGFDGAKEALEEDVPEERGQDISLGKAFG
jgi:hypothetical protein